jgi:crotonobetainyl-CoA:carnitine CoA-transferase CaiB-like acyl-CoA transferase
MNRAKVAEAIKGKSPTEVLRAAADLLEAYRELPVDLSKEEDREAARAMLMIADVLITMGTEVLRIALPSFSEEGIPS